MVRREKISLLEDLIHITSQLPSCVGIALAVFFYLILSRFAVLPDVLKKWENYEGKL